MQHTNQLTYDTLDSEGKVPSLDLKNTYWRHTGNNKVYCVMDFVWNGKDDTWMFAMLAINQETKEVEGPYIVRPLSHLFGNRSTGTPRYTAA